MANVKVPPFTEAPSTVVGGAPTSVFPFDFPFWAAADILVYIDGVLLAAADYSVEGFYIQGDPPAAVEGGYGSGEVTLDTPVSDVTVTIDRLVVGDRQTQFSRASPLAMPVLNGDLNRLTARQQDLARRQATMRTELDQFDGDIAAAAAVVAEIETAGVAQVAAVADQSATSVAAVASQGTTSIAAVSAQQTTSVAAVVTQQTTSVAAVVTQGTTTIAAVNAAGATIVADAEAAQAAAEAAAADLLEYGANLWSSDPADLTSGQNLNTGTGALVANAGFALSDYIAVTPSTQYTFRYAGNVCWFTDNTGTFISGTAPVNGETKTSPGTANYMRIAVTNASVPGQQINEGASLLAYDQPFTRVSEGRVQSASIEAGAVDDEALHNPEPVARQLLEHLGRAGIATKIALYGDSITSGVGATGYTLTGATIAGSVGSIARVNTTCPNWGNLLRDYLVARFGGSRRIYPWGDPWVELGDGVAAAYQKTGIVTTTVSAGDLFSTVFDGDDLTVRYVTGTTRGIFEVIVDGVTEATVDCYAASSSTVSEVLTGLGAGAHTVRIRQTGTKNASSGGYTCAITYLIVTKSITVDNMGVSGATSGTISDIVTANVTTADNFSIIMAGTNDRVTGTPDVIKNNLYAISETIRVAAPDCRVILMSAQPGPPSGGSSEFTNVAYVYYTPDVDMAVAQAAHRIGTLHISHYNEWSNYIRATSVIPATAATMLANHALLMSDGVHPNDDGYAVMFRSILTRLGMAQILA